MSSADLFHDLPWEERIDRVEDALRDLFCWDLDSECFERYEEMLDEAMLEAFEEYRSFLLRSQLRHRGFLWFILKTIGYRALIECAYRHADEEAREAHTIGGLIFKILGGKDDGDDG